MANGLLDSVVAMWPMNNNIFDSLDVYASGGGGTTFPFSHVAGVTASVTGKFVPGLAKAFSTSSANRMDFDDSSGQVFAAGDNDFTVMAWVFSSRTTNNPYLAKWPSDASNNSWLLLNVAASQSHQFSCSGDGTLADETIVTIANPDTSGGGSFWQLVVAGFDSGTQEVWISLDGGAKTRVSHTGGAFAGGNSRLSVGWFATLFGSHDQDESAYWDRQLSDSDISTIWNGGTGLRMTEWDATVPEADGTGILTGLVSWYDMFEASGGDRIDLQSGNNNLSETGAGAPIDQGSGLPAIAKTTAHADFSSNPSPVEFLEKTSPVGMNNGAGSFTVCGFFEFDPKEGDFQGLISRWLAAGNQRQFMLYINSGPSATWQMNVNVDGTGPGTSAAVAAENFTAAPVGNSITRFAIGWYDGSDNTVNIQLSNGPVVSAAGPASIFTATQAFQVGHTNNVVTQPLVGGTAFVGYWNRVLTQLQRTFLYNFFGGQTFASLVAADAGAGAAGADNAAYNYYWSQRRLRA